MKNNMYFTKKSLKITNKKVASNDNFKNNYRHYMEEIEKIVEIVGGKKNEIKDYEDITSNPEYSKLISNIPEQFRVNIFVSVKHFIHEEQEFKIWVNEINQKEHDIEIYMKFPIKEIFLPKDDVLDYENDICN